MLFPSAILLLFLLHRCHSWNTDTERVKLLISNMTTDLIYDQVRKAERVWVYRKVFSGYASFAVAERVYVIRARFASMMRAYFRNQMKSKMYMLETLLRNALIIQRRTESIYILKDELVDLDIKLTYEGNPLNWTRFENNNCHVAGPPCDIVPTTEGYFRRSAMDQDLQIIETRRKFIREKYQSKKNKPPIDINVELNRSLNFKYTTSSGYRHTSTDFDNLAPEFI